MTTLTTRELRVVAAILDGLNKARATNARLGVPTTPDVFPARFPTGLVAVLRWTEAVRSDDPTRQRHLERCARHRDGYVLDLDTPADFAAAVQLQDPQPVKRPTRGRNTDHGIVAKLAPLSEEDLAGIAGRVVRGGRR